MRRLILLLLFLCLTSVLFADGLDGIETAIQTCAREIGSKTPADSTIVVFPIKCDSKKMSNYLNEQLSLCLMNNEHLKVIDQEQLDQNLSETGLQHSAEIDDQSALFIGRKFCAQTIVFGRFDFLGGGYSLLTQVLVVKTAKHQFIDAQSIANDANIKSLMADKIEDKTVPCSIASATTECPENNSDSINSQEDFSLLQRIGAAAINPICGLGSFMMGDTGGGMLIVATSVGGQFLLSAVNKDSSMCLLFSYAAGAVIGIIRAATFHKGNLKNTASVQSSFNISVLPSFSTSEQSTVKLMYTVQY